MAAASMDPASILFKTLAALCLMALNAALITAENSLVTVRRARIERLVHIGEARARFVADAIQRPHEFRSIARAGSVIGSIALAVLAYHSLRAIVVEILTRLTGSIELSEPYVWTSHAVAALAALGMVSWIYAAMDHRLPRLVPERLAEQIVLWSARPLLMLSARVRPLLNAAANVTRAAVRALGMPEAGGRNQPEPESPHTADPATEEHEEAMIAGLLEFRERVVREVMTPRPDMVALPITASRAEVLDIVISKGHSRLPVYDGHLDNIVGVLLVKDLLPYLVDDSRPFDLRRIMREPYFVPDTKRVDQLLAEFRARSIHLAIVLDEFGGTAGLVTLEDLIEEIVGDIYDEYDRPEPEFTVLPDGDVLMDGGASIGDVNERFGLTLSEHDFDTIGGYVFGELGRIPEVGDAIDLEDGRQLRVEEIADRRVTRVRLTTAPASQPTA